MRLRIDPLAGRIVWLAFLLLAGSTAFAQSETTPPKVELANTQLLHVKSAIASRDYDIEVQLPGNYSDTSKVFPVLYVLDGQWDFPLVASLYGQQYYDGFMPAAIVVGITWGGQNPNYDSLRAGDLSPTFNKQIPQSGNGPKYLSFIKQELIPMIDARYRTMKNDRTLMGSSFGGLFTLYALFRETTLFDRYVLTSPYIGWDNGVISTFEKDYTRNGSHVPVRVFIAEGGLESGVAEFNKFVDHLKSQNSSGLHLETRIVEGAGHSGAKAEGFTRGLQSVFARPSLSLDASVLDRYVGEYDLAPFGRITISREHDRLIGQPQNGPKEILYAASETDFYVLGQLLSLHFKTDGSGKVIGFQLKRYGMQDFAKKIN